MDRYSKFWFRQRLTAFLHERHPHLENDLRLIDRRSGQAARIFGKATEKG